MLSSIFALVTLAVVTTASSSETRICDVVVIGVGAAGSDVMNALMDAGVDVCGIEKTSGIGGGPFQAGPIDIFRNSSFAAAMGFANFTLTNAAFNASMTGTTFDFVKYIQRFVRPYTIVGFPLFGFFTNYWADYNGLGLNTTIPPTNFTAELTKLANKIHGWYSFLEQPFYPSTMPLEMAGSYHTYLQAVTNCSLYDGVVCEFWSDFTPAFTEFMVGTLGYQIVYVTTGGLGKIDSVPAVDVFKNWLPSGMLAAIETGNYFFNLGGDTEIYTNMATRFGDSLYLNATVHTVLRPDAEYSSGKVKVFFTQTNADGTTSAMKRIVAKKLVLGLPQYLDNLKFMDLKPIEVNAYTNVSYTVYYQIQYSSNTSASISPIYLMDFANTQNFLEPQLPAVTGIFNYGMGPTAATRSGFGFDLGPPRLPLDAATLEFRDQLSNLLNYGMNITLNAITPHDFYTHFNATCLTDCLARGSGCWTDIYALQGKYNTYRVGKAISFEDRLPIAYTAFVTAQQILADL